MPTIVHEDAAPFSKRKGVNVLQWGPLMVNGSDMESRFVYYNHIAKNKARPAATARRAWDEFWEDVGSMADGVDRFGAPIAQDEDGTKWCFIFTFAENDYDMDVEHGLPNCKRALLFCKHCRATNITKRGMVNPHPHIDHGPRATWRDTMVTPNTDERIANISTGSPSERSHALHGSPRGLRDDFRLGGHVSHLQQW